MREGGREEGRKDDAFLIPMMSNDDDDGGGGGLKAPSRYASMPGTSTASRSTPTPVSLFPSMIRVKPIVDDFRWNDGLTFSRRCLCPRYR